MSPTLWDSKIELSEKFFHEIIRHPVPLVHGPQTVIAGPRSLPVADLPHLHSPLRAS